MLILIGLLGGLITGISPCILPVLPVVFLTGGAQSARALDVNDRAAAPVSRWRPYLVIAGLVTSFTLVTLFGSILLSALSLPQDVLRWAGIVVLVVLGISLLVPAVAHLLEKPFSWIPQREVSNRGSGFGVGLALGAVFVPCAGPVLAAIIVAGSTGQIGADTVALTLSFAIGVAIPLLVFALAGRGLFERVKAFRSRQRGIRIAAGIAMVALAVGLVFDVPAALQRLVPDYTQALQEPLTQNEEVTRALDLGGLVTDENRELANCTNGATELESCGTAPQLSGIQEWFNTDGDAALDLRDLRGEVVLIDFWAYSCINCQRSIPHVVAWDQAYRDAGLRVIGVHSPEYAFEKDVANVKEGAANFGIDYPVAIDNQLSTWTTYRNRYWPAHYLIDATGTVRHISFGEGNYQATEKMIRELLVDADPEAALPGETQVADDTPEVGSITPETFLGRTKETTFGGAENYGRDTAYAVLDQQPQDTFSLGGEWSIQTQFATPVGESGDVRLAYRASQVRAVLAGSGWIDVTRDGQTERITVDGTPRSYELFSDGQPTAGIVDVRVGSGVEVYSFTFG